MLEVYVDGATAGNPGESGIGFVIKNKKICHQGYAYIGQASNHQAEFEAVIHALRYCQKQFPDTILSIRSDSKLVVDAIEKRFVKRHSFKAHLNQILEYQQVFPHCFIKWIPDQQNKQADRLARLALQTKQSAITECP
ncbi:ribonuclease HI family protein [Amphibacillus sediminis]|uniref:ribonuclease HI family protein n=1 Tax=Amphibacillus sediminis TaxID=360185 RepID=UPI000835549A|nr:ribonuclease HI family protein [Amphibacillus sediminis]